MANAKSETKVRIFRENTNWKNLLSALVALVTAATAAYYLKNDGTLRLGLSQTPSSCQNLPDQFESKALPRQIACWRLKLKPDEFSGKVILPENVKFTLRWQTSQLVQIRNGNGEVLTIDPRIQNSLGRHEGNLVLQFKGNGAVLILITGCY